MTVDETATSCAPDRAHFARYAGGALLCALVNNLILISTDKGGLPDLVGVMLAWCVGSTIGYMWHHRLTFRMPPSLAGYRNMMVGTLLGLPISYAILIFLHRWLAWPMWLAAPVMTVIMVVYNYLNARLAILFRRQRTN